MVEFIGVLYVQDNIRESKVCVFACHILHHYSYIAIHLEDVIDL